MLKKFSAIVLALAMMLTLSTTMVSAAGETVAATVAGDVYEGETFELNITVGGVEKYAGIAIKFAFDPAVIQPIAADGTPSKKWNDIKINGATSFMKEMDKIMDNEAGTFEYTVLPDAMHDDYDSEAPYLTGVTDVATIRFKAIADGSMGITFSKTDLYVYDDETSTSVKVAATDATTALASLEIPAKPTLEGAKITGTMESGKTLTASYTFNNGKSSDTASDDKTTFAWFADGEAIVDEEGKAITTKTLVLNDSLVGAVITCEATPNTSRTPADKLNAKGDKVTLKTEPADAIVMPAEGYVPTAEVTIEKITAGKAPEVDVDIKALAAMTTSADYKWYVVAEADDEADAIADLKAAIEAGGEGAPVAVDTELLTEKLTKEYKGQYAVLEVIAKAKIADKTYTAAEAVYDAAEIKVKKSGGTTQTGASLVTGGNVTVKPEEPVKPEDPEVPTEPEKDPEDPAGTANDKGAAAFTDVDKEAYAWAYDSIDTLAKAGVIKGMTETTFGPELTTTNAQVIALAVRIAGLTAEEGATTDKVDAEHWVAGEMAIADANEILAVFGDKVDVEGETTREIAFTLLYNALKAAGVELPETAEAIEYSDAASISEGCVEAIEALTKAGIVNGMGDGTLAPKATITRAQLAKILGLAEALIK